MKIGTLGAGIVAQAVARHAIGHGHEVVLSNRRGPASLAGLVEGLGPLASAGTAEEAAAAELVLLAVNWTQVPDAVAGLPAFDGRIVIDATNQFTSLPPHAEIADLGELTGSEYIASLLPGARVVKAFNTLYGQYIAADPRHDAGRQILFLAGEDAAAKDIVGELTAGFGFAPVDVGGLRDGGRLMQLGGPLSGLHALRQD
ncbi:NADPH-dependent F420 reductase [Streptomyces sp. AK02-01A]|uniref:NADPH-dependent F420 reductase n=1 Tax=Streptomyces sp. AK02-01A TaxID=3028648 RepID=UPI0029BEF352|nr:NAD(P)-binding domain-containing protein [Streptomyces sp. AK02-01A]MDX3853961.1 NAD(P)-binding domain-containing protein [Streptomyces sp. AK02-01A]